VSLSVGEQAVNESAAIPNTRDRAAEQKSRRFVMASITSAWRRKKIPCVNSIAMVRYESAASQ
jgi:hypothetical protein